MSERQRAASRLGVSVICALVLSGCALLGGGPADAERDADGAVVASQEASVFSLDVGDCLNTADLASGELDAIPTLPCAEPHDSEIYAEILLTGDEWPGLDSVDTQVDDFCYAQFPGFVGVSYQESVLYYITVTPTQTSWEQADDRIGQCIVIDDDGGVTGSLRGAAR